MNNIINKIFLLLILLIVFFIIILLLYYFYNTLFNNGKKQTFVVRGKDGIDYKVKKYKDAKKAANLLTEVNNKTMNFMTLLKNLNLENTDFYNEKERLLKNYNPDELHENIPNLINPITSYTYDKGKYIKLCLRDKKTKKLHDINTIMFVKLHELAHIATERGKEEHGEDFWSNFKTILYISQLDPSIIKLINYKLYPINYCGMKISDNPYFDEKVKLRI